MRVQWYGQSAFVLSGGGSTVAIDPFGAAFAAAIAARGMQFDYPEIEGVEADLVLVTHEHGDHIGVEMIGGEPAVLRSTAGTLESPVGPVKAIASEHDEHAGTERGPNTIFRFELEGVRVCHFGDFGQSALREEQAQAIGEIDLLFIPVGGGPTIDGAHAREIVRRLAPRWAVPMHYRTPRIGFLETADSFLDGEEPVERLEGAAFETSELPSSDGPLLVVPAVP